MVDENFVFVWFYIIVKRFVRFLWHANRLPFIVTKWYKLEKSIYQFPHRRHVCKTQISRRPCRVRTIPSDRSVWKSCIRTALQQKPPPGGFPGTKYLEVRRTQHHRRNPNVFRKMQQTSMKKVSCFEASAFPIQTLYLRSTLILSNLRFVLLRLRYGEKSYTHLCLFEKELYRSHLRAFSKEVYDSMSTLQVQVRWYLIFYTFNIVF